MQRESKDVVVEHIKENSVSKMTYENLFYTIPKRKAQTEKIKLDSILGFPIRGAIWCNSCLKKKAFSNTALSQGRKIKTVQYLGIASDEPKRIERHNKKGVILPLVDIGWDEAYCRKWCEENGLLSPIYISSARGGCWFCHNQSIAQLRQLRHDYPDLWALLMKWDLDSPTTFKADGHTVHDYDKRFRLEDEGKLTAGDRKFRWKQILNL